MHAQLASEVARKIDIWYFFFQLRIHREKDINKNVLIGCVHFFFANNHSQWCAKIFNLITFSYLNETRLRCCLKKNQMGIWEKSKSSKFFYYCCCCVVVDIKVKQKLWMIQNIVNVFVYRLKSCTQPNYKVFHYFPSKRSF